MSSHEELYEAFSSSQDLMEEMALQDIEIDRDAPLDTYLYTQAHLYYKWANLATIADARAAKQRILVKEELWPLAREGARVTLTNKGDKVTESRIDDVASVNAAYRGGQSRLIDLEAMAASLRSAERAMHQRLEMLRSINSRQRVELSGMPS